MENGPSGYPISDRMCERYYNQGVDETELVVRGIRRGELEQTALASLGGGIGECRTCGGCLAVIPGLVTRPPKECEQQTKPHIPSQAQSEALN